MKIIEVDLHKRSYPIWINNGIIKQIPDLFDFHDKRKWIIITQQSIQKLFGQKVIKRLTSAGLNVTTLVIPEGEEAKSLSQVESLYHRLLEHNCDRSSILVAFGGGALLAFASPANHDMQSNLILGIGFSLIGALTVTFYFLIGKKILQDSPLWPYFAFVNLSSALFLFIYCLIKGYRTELFQYSAFVYLLFVIAALAPSLIGHATYNYSLRNLPAFVVGVAILGEPIGATILGVIMLDQKPDLITILYADSSVFCNSPHCTSTKSIFNKLLIGRIQNLFPC